MSKNIVTEGDRLRFIHLMSNAKKSSEQNRRVKLCLENLKITEYKSHIEGEKEIQKNSFNNNRRKHRPDITASLLSLFGAPSGLKFLTHDFDPNSNQSMKDIIDTANRIINSTDYRFKIPGSLYSLFNGFINGPTWTDYKKDGHSFYLKSHKVTNWITTAPSIHPLVSDEFGDEINSFRNTVRISKPNLDSIFKLLLNNDPHLKNLKVISDKLDKADFYTNVFWMTFMIFRNVLIDIAQRDSEANLKIEFERSSWQEYRLCSIKIIHIDSEANPFEETKRKLMRSGGALYNLMSSCCGYCDWTLEANFEGEYKRWRVLNLRNLPEEEGLSADEVDGFSHIFTFYKK